MLSSVLSSSLAGTSSRGDSTQAGVISGRPSRKLPTTLTEKSLSLVSNGVHVTENNGRLAGCFLVSTIVVSIIPVNGQVGSKGQAATLPILNLKVRVG